MAEVTLRAPLSELCGGRSHDVPGSTVADVLRELERAHPAVAGWILDEHGDIRAHVNVYVNGDAGNGATTVTEGDRVQILPAITGG